MKLIVLALKPAYCTQITFPELSSDGIIIIHIIIIVFQPFLSISYINFNWEQSLITCRHFANENTSLTYLLQRLFTGKIIIVGLDERHLPIEDIFLIHL